MSLRKKAVWVVGIVFVAALFALVFGHREERVRLLYAGNGDSYDRAAYLNFEQSTVANADVERRALEGLGPRQLGRYDAIYLDPSLKQSAALREALPALETYVSQGGHLFVENGLLNDLPLELLGASAIKPMPPTVRPAFAYPQVRSNLQGLQDVFRNFAETFVGHAYATDLNEMMPGFDWGQAIVPSTAETIVSLNGEPAVTINRYGRGTVLASTAFLPNRYFITGFDLLSGMDPAAGFTAKAMLHDQSIAEAGSRASRYFNFKNGLPQKPYFQFGFSAANHLFRNEYLAYVSKEKLGYSVKKVLGPYGRPAMAYQNHFEALPAFEHKEAIAWAELLKTYNQIPSYSLVRSSFDWHRWYEGITVHLNTGTSEQPKFVGELPNSFYSSGTLVESEGKPIALAAYPGKHELAVKLELPYRAYPALADVNGDGRADLIVGSADGYLYRYPNTGRQEASTQMAPQGLQAPDGFGAPEKLLLADGQPVATAGHASVAAADLNGDGLADLVIGDKSGNVSVLLALTGGLFASPVPLEADGQPIRVSAYSAPAVGDLDGDGTPDLVVGDAGGQLVAYAGIPGEPLRFAKGVPLFKLDAGYAAPSIRDLNGDGKADLAVGNSEGDVLVYLRDGDSWSFQGPIEGETTNPMGTRSLVGGQYSVPLWADLNHDGKDDLIVGQVQYSQPVPIDDPAFPYKQQLMEFLDYAKANKLEIIPHVYVHNFLDPEQEKRELELQRRSFATLGLPWGKTGANQHTWRINQVDPLQTLRSENEADIWFNFGFKPANSPTEPQWGRDYLWSYPFLLAGDKLKSPMLLYAPAFRFSLQPDGLRPDTTDVYRSLAELDMPIDYFEHIEYQYDDPGKTEMLTAFVRYFDQLRNDYDYNFMTEPQMARSFLAALTSDIRVERPWLVYAMDKLKDKLGRGKHLTLQLSVKTKGVPDLAAEYRNTAGVVIEPGEAYAGHPFATDSPVFTKRNNKLYTGLGIRRLTTVSVNWSAEPFHIVRSNVPVSVEGSGKSWTIGLNSEGMQQIKLYGPRPLQIEGDDLRVDRDGQKGTYTVTHFGARTKIKVTMP